MKTLFSKFGLLTLMCLTLLCSLLRPCAAQRATLFDVSWAGNSAVPQLYVNVRGGVDNYFGVSGTTWTCAGRITGTSMSQDATGLHVDVSADVLYFGLVGNDFGSPTSAEAVLHVTIAPNGKVTEFVELQGMNFSLITPPFPIIRGSAYFFWLP